MEAPATDHPSADQGKESLDLVQPGTAGRGEMEVEAPPLLRLEPALDRRALVRTVVVHDQVHFLIVGKLLFQVIQEPNELATAVALLTSADHFANEDVESGEQSGRAVTLVIVGLPFW